MGVFSERSICRYQSTVTYFLFINVNFVFHSIFQSQINDVFYYTKYVIFSFLKVIAVAFSSLVNALFETNMLAIVRRVYDARSGPRIGCLKPHIKNDYEVRETSFFIIMTDCPH